MTLAAIIPADSAQPMTLEYLDGPGSFLRHLDALNPDAVTGEDFTAYVRPTRPSDPLPVNTRAEAFVNERIPSGHIGGPLTGTVVVLGPMDGEGGADVSEHITTTLGLTP
ncbi:hypothetical protein [Micrococcus luteus]|uniref:hypothetical protein n=1 Tax=Micrococcus luteus TaxID=1270 RepID=UPI0023047A08|nr:hypothetical protein [Micrococcus luteus]